MLPQNDGSFETFPALRTRVSGQRLARLRVVQPHVLLVRNGPHLDPAVRTHPFRPVVVLLRHVHPQRNLVAVLLPAVPARVLLLRAVFQVHVALQHGLRLETFRTQRALFAVDLPAVARVVGEDQVAVEDVASSAGELALGATQRFDEQRLLVALAGVVGLEVFRVVDVRHVDRAVGAHDGVLLHDAYRELVNWIRFDDLLEFATRTRLFR